MRIAFILKKLRLPPNLGISYLSQNLKSAGYEVKLFMVNKNFEKVIKKIREYKPSVVGYSVYTGEQEYYINFNRVLKEQIPVVSVFGGMHPTFFPEMIEEDKCIDAVCRGEGELAFVEFLDKFKRDGALPAMASNFWVKKDGSIFKNDVMPFVTNLDRLGFPDRQIFYEVEPFLKKFSMKNFMAHRGCPFKCTYCFNHKLNELYKNKNIYRSRTPEHVIEEIIKIRSESRLEQVNFYDDLFTLDKHWFMRFAKLYKKEVALPYSINIRLNVFSEDVAKILKDSGCHFVTAGVESGTDFVRNQLMKRNMNRETILKASEILKKYSIRLITENIIGLPGENYAMAKETLMINTIVKPEYANASIFYPYPRTELCNYAIEKGYYNKTEVSGESYMRKSTLRFDNPKDKNRIENLKCFFSFLARNPSFINIFEKLFLNLKNNFLFWIFGDIADTFYHRKLIALKIDFIKLFYLFRIVCLYIKGR